MSSLLSGIIDCVARPSTSDSPVRVIRKSSSKSESPKSIAEMPISGSETQRTSSLDSQSLPRPASEVFVPGEATAVFPVSTAEAVIMIPEGDAESECDDSLSSQSIDQSTRQQFEAAFATFLYKNPAFTSMSHANLTRLRSKLSKECARNLRAETELRRQLEDLREAKRRTELNLQRELLVVTRAKAAREAELRDQIRRTRQATMSMETPPHQGAAGYSPLASSHLSHSYSPAHASPASFADYPAPWPTINASDSFQEEINKSRLEHVFLRAEMEKLQQKMTDSSLNM